MNVTVGASLPLSGPYRKSGETSLALLERAASELKAYTPAELLVEDMAASPVEAVRRLARRGARMIIGGEASMDLEAVIPVLWELKVPHLNFISTTPGLAADDYSYRMLPDDRYEAGFMAALMAREGIRTVVPLWRGDEFGDQLQAIVRKQFRDSGGAVKQGARYDPEATDFGAAMQALSAQLQECWRSPGALPAAVYLVAFDEAAPLFRSAATTSGLPLVKWYGSNGTTFSDALATDWEAARFAVRTGFTSPAPGLSQTARPKWQPLLSTDVNVFNLLAYDAFWLAAQALMIGGEPRAALAARSGFYFGATGPCAFNAAGDRKAMYLETFGLTETGFRWSS